MELICDLCWYDTKPGQYLGEDEDFGVCDNCGADALLYDASKDADDYDLIFDGLESEDA